MQEDILFTMGVTNDVNPSLKETNLIHSTYDGNFQLDCDANVVQFCFTEEEKEDGVSCGKCGNTSSSYTMSELTGIEGRGLMA